MCRGKSHHYQVVVSHKGNNLPPLLAKQIAMPSLPHQEDKGQRNVNGCWSCSMGNLGVDGLQYVIN